MAGDSASDSTAPSDSASTKSLTDFKNVDAYSDRLQPRRRASGGWSAPGKRGLVGHLKKSALDPKRHHSSVTGCLTARKLMLRVRRQAWVRDSLDDGMALERLGHGGGVPLVRGHAQVQGLES
jgi:hypothetical protein